MTSICVTLLHQNIAAFDRQEMKATMDSHLEFGRKKGLSVLRNGGNDGHVVLALANGDKAGSIGHCC